MSGYRTEKIHNNVQIPTATGIISKVVDVSMWDKFCLTYQNSNTSIAFLDLIVQAAINPDSTAADAAPNWVQINTATLPQPSALGATATIMTSAVDNCYRYIRILGKTSATAAVGTLTVTVAGFTRY